jgi:hypothetical protein
VDKRSLVLYLSGLAAAGAVVGLAASCSDQPRIKCTAGHGPFAAVYTPKGGADPCGIPGELIGVEAYNYPLPDNANLDPNRGSLGMQPLDLAAAIAEHAEFMTDDKNPAHIPHALGDWGSAEPGGDNFCAVPNPTDIEQDLGYVPKGPDLPDGGAGRAAIPALSLKYHWTNVRFYNTPASPGTQLIADLSYTATRGLADGGAGSPCTAEYKVVGLWPWFDCSADVGDGIDETKCSPFADPTKNRPTGSGISPDLATRCDPVLKFCVLAKDPPSFK